MSEPRDDIDRIAEKVADGAPVEWVAEETRHPELKELLEPLRALEALGQAHRTAGRPVDADASARGASPGGGKRRDPRSLAGQVESAPQLPPGDRERFNGYGLMGLPFTSGHILAMRRFTASSVGPGYASVWHRDPAGAWTFYADTEPRVTCTRYFGRAAARAIETRIAVTWPEPHRLRIEIPSARLEWDAELGSTFATSVLNRLGGFLPDPAWRSPAVLRAMTVIAGSLLHAGHIGLSGAVPNGQGFVANPRVLWVVRASRASLGGTDLGTPGPVRPQARLGDFWIPQRGVFALGQAYFDPFDPSRHSASTAATGESVAIES
jgi:hypothetical protein